MKRIDGSQGQEFSVIAPKGTHLGPHLVVYNGMYVVQSCFGYSIDKCPWQDEGERIEVRNCVLELCILSALIVLVLLQPQNRDRSLSHHAHGFPYGQGENSSVEANYLSALICIVKRIDRSQGQEFPVIAPKGTHKLGAHLVVYNWMYVAQSYFGYIVLIPMAG